jgi:hypothetical protein
MGIGIGIGVRWGETDEPKFLPSGGGPELRHGSETKATARAIAHFIFIRWRSSMAMASMVIWTPLDEAHVSFL